MPDSGRNAGAAWGRRAGNVVAAEGCGCHHGDERVVRRDEFTLDELAAATRMTARNVRAYQTKGLIPAPSRSGRRSVYRGEHLQRLQAIEQARRRGASLSLIAAHLAAGRALDGDTLIDWQSDGPTLTSRPRSESHDIAPLLAQLDGQYDGQPSQT